MHRPLVVRTGGLEPPHLTVLVPKTSASTIPPRPFVVCIKGCKDNGSVDRRNTLEIDRANEA